MIGKKISSITDWNELFTGCQRCEDKHGTTSHLECGLRVKLCMRCYNDLAANVEVEKLCVDLCCLNYEIAEAKSQAFDLTGMRTLLEKHFAVRTKICTKIGDFIKKGK